MIMRSLFISFISLYTFASYAADLPDPPRPPAMFAGSSSSGRGSAENRSSGLQTTIISGTRRAAIIDGKTVELWAKHGSAQLIEVNEGSVVLKGRQTRRILTLFPGVRLTQREIKTNVVPPVSGAQSIETNEIPAAQGEQPVTAHPEENK